MRVWETIHIGTSGWHYDHWRGTFYPKDLSKDDFLSHYSGDFNTVEINNSFYQIPRRETMRKWRDATPGGFIFSVKASRYITHMKKLKDAEKTLKPLMEALSVLEGKLGPILFQLPPKWHFNFERFKAFLNALPKTYRYAFEFRDPTWFDLRACEELEKHGAAFCIYEFAERLSPKRVTADFIYVRLHGPKGAYKGQYEDLILQGWASDFAVWESEGKEVFCYFDNDEAGYAPQDARRLRQMIR